MGSRAPPVCPNFQPHKVIQDHLSTVATGPIAMRCFFRVVALATRCSTTGSGTSSWAAGGSATAPASEDELEELLLEDSGLCRASWSATASASKALKLAANSGSKSATCCRTTSVETGWLEPWLCSRSARRARKLCPRRWRRARAASELAVASLI